MLGHEVTKRYRGEGLPDNTIDITFTGSAGQSFGAFVPRGITLRLVGDANDYVGKGLSGGRIIVRPHDDASFPAHNNVIAGNVLLYGATSGEAFVRGVVGERFGVRNSGASAVVEGVGDHGCEYMTGGVVVVLGTTGRNFAAGMSGGLAYVFDEDGQFVRRCNQSMVALEVPAHDELELVYRLAAEHHARTGSAKAQELLSTWAAVVPKLVKVLPSEMKRLHAEKSTPETAGKPTTAEREPASRPYVPLGSWRSERTAIHG